MVGSVQFSLNFSECDPENSIRLGKLLETKSLQQWPIKIILTWCFVVSAMMIIRLYIKEMVFCTSLTTRSDMIHGI